MVAVAVYHCSYRGRNVEIQYEGYMCAFVCVCIGMLKDFLLCVPSTFYNHLGRSAKGQLIFLGKEG